MSIFIIPATLMSFLILEVINILTHKSLVKTICLILAVLIIFGIIIFSILKQFA